MQQLDQFFGVCVMGTVRMLSRVIDLPIGLVLVDLVSSPIISSPSIQKFLPVPVSAEINRSGHAHKRFLTHN